MKKNENRIFWGTLLILAFFLAVLTFCSPCCFGAEIQAYDIDAEDINVEFYYHLAAQLGLGKEVCEEAGIDYETSILVLPDQMKDFSEGTIVVEMVLGICCDEDGNGCVLNTSSWHDYISYAERDEKTGEWLFSWNEPGDIVMSFLVYKRDNYEDDCDRYDYILDTNQLIEE